MHLSSIAIFFTMPQSLELASSCCSTSSSSLFEHQASNSSDCHTDSSPPISDEKQPLLAERVWYIPHRISRSRPKEAPLLLVEEELDYDAEPEGIKESPFRGNRLFTKKRVASGQKRRSSIRVAQEKTVLPGLGVVLAGAPEQPSSVLSMPQKPRLMATMLPGSPSPVALPSRMFSPLAPFPLHGILSPPSALIGASPFMSPMSSPCSAILVSKVEHAPGLGLVYTSCQFQSPSSSFVEIPLSPLAFPPDSARPFIHDLNYNRRPSIVGMSGGRDDERDSVDTSPGFPRLRVASYEPERYTLDGLSRFLNGVGLA
ncbi:hypothetical protein CPB85DRAFT_1454965 [Mucidula mucida]|nr:hypothetical protein CPB85DRAFT_898744 [Mucidula mucida]KAF8912569.1 hypothetical protein CPB85DRAFT_1454965 [Mucidula mucida]